MKSCVIAVCLIEKEGKFLIGKKQNNIGPYPNSWHIPEGGVKLGEESLEDALQREVKEETGMTLTQIERVGFDEDYEKDKHGGVDSLCFSRLQSKV